MSETEGLCGSRGEVFRTCLGLGEKIGPVLFQLPPALKIDPERLRTFLRLLPTNEKYSFEFGNQAGFTLKFILFSLNSGPLFASTKMALRP
ncbi:MAG: DUF72 domain-containing protein [Syntrophobacteraceae bacterium]